MGYPKIVGAGTTTTSSGSSQAVALPKLADATTVARYVRVVGTTLGYIKFGVGAPTCTANDILVTSEAEIFDVGGFSHYAVLQETAACKINVVAVET